MKFCFFLLIGIAVNISEHINYFLVRYGLVLVSKSSLYVVWDWFKNSSSQCCYIRKEKTWKCLNVCKYS